MSELSSSPVDLAESISPRKKPKLPEEFREKSNRYGLLLTLRTVSPLFISIISVGYFAPSQWNFSYALISTFLLGWAAYRIQFVLHDTCHMSLFKSRKINDLVGFNTGLLIGISFSRYRTIHFLHHKFNGLVEDPQLPDYLGDEKLSKLNYIKFLIEPLFGIRVMPFLKRDFLEIKIVSSGIPKKSNSWYFYLLSTQLAICTVLSWGSKNPYVILFNYVGMATFSLYFARQRALAEHQQIGTDFTDFSRTHKWNLLDTIFLQDANFCYHLEHHMYPSVQSRHLPRLMSTVTEEIHTQESMGKSMFSTLFLNIRKL
jgi:fatty acid desaturase